MFCACLLTSGYLLLSMAGACLSCEPGYLCLLQSSNLWIWECISSARFHELAVADILGVKPTVGVGVVGVASAHDLPLGPVVNKKENVFLPRCQSRRSCVLWTLGWGVSQLGQALGQRGATHLLAWW